MMALALLINYLCHKTIIIKYVSKSYEKFQFTKLMNRSFLIILFIKLCISLWSLTSPIIFDIKLFSKISLNLYNFGSNLDRIFQISYLFVMMIIAAAAIIVDVFLNKFIGWIFGSNKKYTIHSDKK